MFHRKKVWLPKVTTILSTVNTLHGIKFFKKKLFTYFWMNKDQFFQRIDTITATEVPFPFSLTMLISPDKEEARSRIPIKPNVFFC